MIEEAAAALRRGALIIMPTDTVYGIAADPRRPGAEERIFQAKKRSKSKPIAFLAASRDQIEQYHGAFSATEDALAQRYWPGALTLVLSVKDRFEGFRIPDNPTALALIRAVDHPLRVTSANSSGCPPSLTATSALDSLGVSVEIVIDAGPAPGAIPSTVVKIEKDNYHILRVGAIAEVDITETIRESGLKTV